VVRSFVYVALCRLLQLVVLIQAFEANLRANLYKLWNRMSSGSYMPPPVRAVEIPKRSGGSRMLGPAATVGPRRAADMPAAMLEIRLGS
jgi:RNA-directed DNA polymerase